MNQYHTFVLLLKYIHRIFTNLHCHCRETIQIHPLHKAIEITSRIIIMTPLLYLVFASEIIRVIFTCVNQALQRIKFFKDIVEFRGMLPL